MVVDYLKRGVVAGVIAGCGYGLYLAVVANPLVAYVETVIDHGHGTAHGHETANAVSEATTTAVSIGGGVLWGILLGAAFAIAYYLFEPALPGTDAVKPYVLAGAGFLTVSGVPWLVLPPAAPGVEPVLEANVRLLIYAMSMGGGALLAAVTLWSYGRASALASRWMHRTASGPSSESPPGTGRGVETGAASRRVVDNDTFSRNQVLVGILAAVTPVLIVVVVLPRVTPSVVANGELAPELVTAFRGVVVVGQVGLWLLLATSYRWLSRTGRPGSSGLDGRPFDDGGERVSDDVDGHNSDDGNGHTTGSIDGRAPDDTPISRA